MRIRNKALLEKGINKHTNAKNALQNWIDYVEETAWKSHSDLKRDFPSADYVGNGRYVFNIKGNNYRLVVIVLFIKGYISVRFFGTHGDYCKINCKTV